MFSIISLIEFKLAASYAQHLVPYSVQYFVESSMMDSYYCFVDVCFDSERDMQIFKCSWLWS